MTCTVIGYPGLPHSLCLCRNMLMFLAYQQFSVNAIDDSWDALLPWNNQEHSRDRQRLISTPLGFYALLLPPNAGHCIHPNHTHQAKSDLTDNFFNYSCAWYFDVTRCHETFITYVNYRSEKQRRKLVKSILFSQMWWCQTQQRRITPVQIYANLNRTERLRS